MRDMHYYGCCACIGSAGIGMVPTVHVFSSDDKVFLNMFIKGSVALKTPAKSALKIITDTEYPKNGNVYLTLNLDAEERFPLCIRIPHWSKTTSVAVNGENFAVDCPGYAIIDRVWKNSDKIEISLDMRTEAIYPISYGTQVLMNEIIWEADHMIPTFDREDPLASKHIALRRGPIILAQENRLGYSVDDPVGIIVNGDGYVDVVPSNKNIPYPCIAAFDVPTDSGYMTVTDYASAGKLWNEESKLAAWILVK
jgi:hypothetical protein